MQELVEFQKLVDTRGASLRSLGYSDLLSLSDAPVDEITIGKRAGTISTIVETMPDNSLRVVVEGFLDARFIGQHVALDGFYKLPDGSIMPIPDDEFYEFD